ncbi:Abi-alpha family protein [Pseudonocardia spinosispora]|uniref:Abi-alpha family protein n=1 Tax=Pseudonocardia spinosispora TaxID=103441 RepID=UPI00146F99CD|nr:Abi-alpha family protein [Pseudonocardia spinosispora]
MTDASKDPRRPDADRRRAVARAAEQNGSASLLPTTADVVGVVRVAGAVVWRVFTTVTKGSMDTVAELAKEVQAGEPITHIVDHQVSMVQSAVLHALGVENSRQTPNRVSSKRIATEQDLRSVGNALLKGSWRAEGEPRAQHPSFALMLQSLTPDEARILRFLAVAGPQPAIDIRSKTPFGVGSERLAGGITLIAEMAGCTWPERDRHYLANLNRLGLVRFSEEPVTDRRRYAFVEAQPKATEPMERVKKATTIYRSIYLSLFGQQFAEICFDLDGYDAGGWASDDRGDKIFGRRPGKRVRKHH